MATKKKTLQATLRKRATALFGASQNHLSLIPDQIASLMTSKNVPDSSKSSLDLKASTKSTADFSERLELLSTEGSMSLGLSSSCSETSSLTADPFKDDDEQSQTFVNDPFFLAVLTKNISNPVLVSCTNPIVSNQMLTVSSAEKEGGKGRRPVRPNHNISARSLVDLLDHYEAEIQEDTCRLLDMIKETRGMVRIMKRERS